MWLETSGILSSESLMLQGRLISNALKLFFTKFDQQCGLRIFLVWLVPGNKAAAFWCRDGTEVSLVVTELFHRRLHSHALKMGPEPESRCSCSLQGPTSTHHCSGAASAVFHQNTLASVLPPARLIYSFTCSLRIPCFV